MLARHATLRTTAILLAAALSGASSSRAGEPRIEESFPLIINCGAVESDCDCYSCDCDGGLDWSVVLRGGGTYFDTPGDDWQGGTYGLDMAAHLTGDWGLVGSAHMNHLAFGRQIAGSVGLVKLPFGCGCDWRDPISFSLFFDQFTDTRIDTRDGSLYLSQMRAQLGYELSNGLEVGGIYTAPVQEDDDVQFSFTFFPASAPVDGLVKTGESAIGYVAGCVREVQWTLLAGRRIDPGTSVIGGSLRRQFTDRIAAFAGATFETDRGNWGVAYGMEIAFGPSFRGCNSCNCCYATSGAAQATESARGQSPDSNIYLVSVPQDTPDSPPGPANYPSGLGPDTAYFSGPMESPWTQRWFGWNARQLTVALPHDFWRALNADGLTDRTQDAIQDAAGGFSVATRGKGGIKGGRTDGRQRD